MKITKPIIKKYRDYEIRKESPFGYTFVHPDYDGAPDSGDDRCGFCEKLYQVEILIDELIETKNHE